jgi:protein TonB
MLISVGLHAGLLLGFRKHGAKSVAPAKEEYAIALIPMPQIKDLEEPEPATSNDAAPTDLSMPVPMQADFPQLPKPADFVQAINFASLLEQPDFSKLKVYAVPEHIRSGTGKIAEGIGKIFNLADLDRIPEPILQPAPQYPIAMRRDALTATVRVEFIVGTDGRVLDAVVVETTHHGFDEAAVAGVSKWKFKPGMKAGRKVNTRMAVPIVFKFSDLD